MNLRSLVVAATAAMLVQAAPPPSGLTFTRLVSPFPVSDADGRDYPLAFLGGLDVPRPQFVDIDADGDLDLFLQEYSNMLWLFENAGTAAAPRYEWRTDRYLNLEIGDWYRFVDVDADGRIDLLSELPFSHIRHYRNVGTKTAARFEDLGALRDSSGEPLFLDRQNIPALVDLDCDGRLDLFAGRVEGIVARYEAEAPGSARFSLLTERFENIEIVGRGGERPSTRHGANALAFADFDGDADLDLFWGDFFEPAVLLIENIGRTCSSPSFDVDPVPLPYADGLRTSGYNAPAPIDLDLDKDLDFLMGVLGGAFNPVATSADNFYHWQRTAADRLELRTKRFLNGIDLGSESMPALVDLDADDDLDLVVGNKIDPAKGDAARLVTFINEGSANAPRFRQQPAQPMGETYNVAPAFGDLDADGDPDMLLGTWNQDVQYFRNEGSAKGPRWVRDEAATIRPPRLSHAAPALGDIDGDRDLDLFLGQANGAIAFYRNEGSAKAARFVLVSDHLDDIRVGRRSAPALVDVDEDGRLDLVIGREQGGVAVYRSTGGRTSPMFVEYKEFRVPLPTMGSPAFADLDGDGVRDIISGSASGGVLFYRGAKSSR